LPSRCVASRVRDLICKMRKKQVNNIVRKETGMYQEKRPTCVSVIGWAWIVLGGLRCMSSLMGFVMSTFIGAQAAAGHNAQFMFKIFPVLVALQLGAAPIAIILGYSMSIWYI